MSSISEPVRLGVIGLGRGFALTVPTLRADPRVQLVAACDVHGPARQAFAREFGAAVHDDADALCADAAVEAVYIASPHELHVEHGLAAAAHGKHLLVDKPLALDLTGATELVEACEAAGVHLIAGPSHSFDPPVQHARRLIASGALGRVGMLHALNCTDFLYRPRRPLELDPAAGGVVLAQVIHQVDSARLLAGGMATRVTAAIGNWATGAAADPALPGACSALIEFESGTFASLTYSGHGHFDSSVWQGGIGELGRPVGSDGFVAAQRRDGPAGDQLQRKRERGYAGAPTPPAAVAHEHFGPVLVMCSGGDLRITPHGVHVYAADGERFEPTPLRQTRTPVVDALVAAVRNGRRPVQDGRWGLASLEVCDAIVRSARGGAPVSLRHQVPVEDSR